MLKEIYNTVKKRILSFTEVSILSPLGGWFKGGLHSRCRTIWAQFEFNRDCVCKLVTILQQLHCDKVQESQHWLEQFNNAIMCCIVIAFCVMLHMNENSVLVSQSLDFTIIPMCYVHVI